MSAFSNDMSRLACSLMEAQVRTSWEKLFYTKSMCRTYRCLDDSFLRGSVVTGSNQSYRSAAYWKWVSYMCVTIYRCQMPALCCICWSMWLCGWVRGQTRNMAEERERIGAQAALPISHCTGFSFIFVVSLPLFLWLPALLYQFPSSSPCIEMMSKTINALLVLRLMCHPSLSPLLPLLRFHAVDWSTASWRSVGCQRARRREREERR